MSQNTAINEQDSQKVTDEALMLAYAKGDASAFEQLYSRHKQVIFHYFTKQCSSIAIAEELCHDTWLKLINARCTYTVAAKFRTYLFTIARNTLIDHSQKKSTTQEASNIANEYDENSETDKSTLAVNDKMLNTENIQLSEALAQNIAALPTKQREVFLLKQESGFTIEQIAEITTQQKEQVKSSWRYALQRLRKGLSHYV